MANPNYLYSELTKFHKLYIVIDFRDKMKTIDSDIQTFSFGQDLVFDAFIMFKEYIGFVKAMNSLKGMKLLYKDRYEDRAWVANIKVLRLVMPHSEKWVRFRFYA